MPVVTKTQLENAALDATTLQVVVNGSASPGTVTSRLGTPLKTLAKIIDDLATTDIGESAAAQINQNLEATGKILIMSLNQAKVQAMGNPNTVTISESDFEDLPFYDLDTYYYVPGIGLYKGRDFLVSDPIPYSQDNLYVSNSGNNLNPGTDPSEPKQTILSAFNSISAPAGGKTIWLEEGTYAENLTFTNKQFNNPVVIRAMPGHKVTLKSASGANCLFLSGTCRNIKVRNVTFETISSQGQLVNTTSGSLDCGVYDCDFIDANSKPFSVSLTGTGASNGFDLKRCKFRSASTFGINVTALNNARVVGNDLTQCALAGSITVTPNAVGENCRINQNSLLGGVALNGGTGIALIAEVLENDCRFIQHSGGTSVYRSVLTIENNYVNSPTIGISIAGYTIEGTCINNNVVTLGNYAIAWPIDTGTNSCNDHDIIGNNISNEGVNGVGLLIGSDSSNCTIQKNVIVSNNGGRFALSLTGTGHTVSQNTIVGGSSNSLLLKGCISCGVTANTITNSVANSTAIEFALNSATAPTNNAVTGNTVIVSNGRLYNQLAANIGTGNTVNSNTYQIKDSGVWGSLFNAFVNTIAEVRTRWTSQYLVNNDSSSTSS